MARKKARVINSFRGRNAFLSNFHKLHPVTSEHVFQAMKTDDWEWQVEILMAPTPAEAKRLGRMAPLRKGWDDMRVDVMDSILRLKFPLGGGPLTERLIATGDSTLIEGNTWGDRFWGKVGDNGQNFLGRILMSIRDDRQEEMP